MSRGGELGHLGVAGGGSSELRSGGPGSVQGAVLRPPSAAAERPSARLPPPRRYGCEADPGAVASYEAQLFPPFQVVLSEDVQEFHP